ncbi:insulin receptor substrate 1-B isoform X2 [Chiloscyllium plagiosum]|uniref:insulin receptor substrate 1-B isoform X2 n=1 Tax=Chiloscyllium plagiosum TaxID=36176 RepID=UPI001CB8700D|nr:insulin receptor substrate 1-B isoform X2 [Chiloscyllium plagiosum]
MATPPVPVSVSVSVPVPEAAGPPAEPLSDVRKAGYLRKPKSMHRRFFVLRAASELGPARLEYYENEKKWRQKAGAPKRSVQLESCFNINKRADSKNKYLVALYTRDEYFAVAADCEGDQESWYRALLELHNRAKVPEERADRDTAGAPVSPEDGTGEASPGPAFKEVWQVVLKPKGLGHSKNLVGIYRLCLTNKTISLVKLNSEAAAVVLQLMNIRRCGHSENFFFIEVGRSAVTGPGEFWMQVDDSVVAQNMHETILEAMKAMSEEFRPRSKSQSASSSNPISVPLRRHLNNPPPSQVGLSRRSRTESVTASATSPAGKHSSFRVRASSDGEGTMSRPASVDGSPVSPSTGRTHSHRHRGGCRLHPPLNHSRSIPMPSAHCSPSATSPVSLSSSSTSGHGSTSDSLFPRRSSASISGSPSDGGFISSDEYGSSPCDFRNSFRSVTPDSLGHTPPAREEQELNNYIYMGKHSSLGPSCQNRGGQRWTPTKAEDADSDKGFRKRAHSSGTSPPTVMHQKTSSQTSTTSFAEYTEMTPSYPGGRLSSSKNSAFVPTHSYPEECLDLQLGEGRRYSQMDDGYMPMSPGVAPVPNKNDYMPMSPKSVSAPQQIINPRQHSRKDGYMMMSPSGSCSPENVNYGKIWTNGGNSKLSVESNDGKLSCSDYINMSPASCSTTSTPPDCFFNPVEEPHKPVCSYFSLPRSFKHVHRKNDESPLRIAVNSGRLLYCEDSSSSTSSDSLGGQDGGHHTVSSTKKELYVPMKGKLVRPTRLSLDNTKASTLPRTREHPLPPEPKSPGEYVNIEFSDKTFSSSSLSLVEPSSVGGMHSVRQRPPVSEYMNMNSRMDSSKFGYVSKPTVDITNSATACTTSTCRKDRGQASCDYVSMQLVNTCTDLLESAVSNYKEMTVGGGITSSISVLPRGEESSLTTVSDVVAGPTMDQISGRSAFTVLNLVPNRNQGAKVIRVDPQGRRRHSSETFTSTANVTGMTLSYVDHVKRHSSVSFENVWLNKPGDSLVAGAKEQPNDATVQNDCENVMNYIDLDLVNDFKNKGWTSSQHVTPHQPHGNTSGGGDDLNSYASITFQKPDEIVKPTEREE